MSDATEGAPFWQLHIAAWQQSGLTQKAYCEQQELRYSTFGYTGSASCAGPPNR
ncbi:IS66 family insertion sequence element accessory protein TnpA, partial [Thiolapillus sp.]|uniref:IS66 family insertion sequence element accessory protein TnpA n=1 Tax=Thiolapillus sp. TaxID=2017437 RepID=UPI003AF83F36